jgi:uncharacterized membrane protein YhhN
MLTWGMIAISALAALAYGVFFLHKPPSVARAVVKTLFMAPLAALAFMTGQPALFVVALTASAVGDALLAFEKPALVLPLGILAFLTAQICYTFTFLHIDHFPACTAPPIWPRALACAAIVLVSVGFLVWLWPKLGQLAVGVVPYSTAIAAMAMSAMMLPWLYWPTMIGAAFFVVSDSVLSAELFKLAPDAPMRRVTGPIVWWTYVAAQALIFWGAGFGGYINEMGGC